MIKHFEVLWKKKNTLLLSLFIYISFIALAILIMDVISPFYLTINDGIFNLSDLKNRFTQEVMLTLIPALYLIVRYFMVRHKCNKIYSEISGD